MDVFWIPRSHVQDSASMRIREKPSDELRIDEQTFRDLEIFDTQSDEPSVFDLLNRTRTGGGNKVLRTRWKRPLSSVRRIHAVQESIRHILAHERSFNLLPGDAAVTAVEHYLYSGLAVVMSKKPIEIFLQAVESRVGNFRGYWKMVTGVKRTTQLIHTMRTIVDDPALADAPGELGERLAEARVLLDRPSFRALPEDGGDELPFWKIAPIDRSLRDEERGTIELLLRVVFEIDALVSMATAVRDHHFLIPTAHDGDVEFVAEDIWHPFIDRPVPNPLRVDQQQRLLFITGPNMAGKTTYLRACGVAMYLAHLGMGVPARSFRFSPCDSLFSAISLVDSLRAGVSFFQAEALRLKDIALALSEGRRIAALLDEPFMGTNVKDAIDASTRILIRLASRSGSVFLVSSHLIEVSQALLALDTVECKHFEAVEDGDTLQFDYHIRPGVSTQRLGIRVLEEHGVFRLLDQD